MPAHQARPGRPGWAGEPGDPLRADRPGAPDGWLATLPERLARLPAGHPSSPCNDDGSQKPPSFRLRDLELPLSGDDRDGNGHGRARPHAPPARPAAEGALNADGDHHEGPAAVTRPPGSPEQARITDEAIRACRSAEGRTAGGGYDPGGLTPAMRRIEAQLEHGHLIPDTEKFALKSPERFSQKLAGRIALQPDTPPGELAGRIHDGVRYAFIFEDMYYTVGIWQISDLMRRSGYELMVRKPMWHSEVCKGVNSQWRDPDRGTRFEIQFHTPESWAARQRTQEWYRQLTDPATPPADRRRLDELHKEIAGAVPIPPGALQMTPYRQEGA
jgi:hypothetical protein